jgi:hypothetical protein
MKNVKFDKRVEKIFQRGDFKSDLEEKLGRLDSTGSYWRRYVLRSAMKNSGKIIMDEDNIDMKGNEFDDEDEERKTLVIKLSTYEKIRQSKIKRKKSSKKVEEIQDGILISA